MHRIALIRNKKEWLKIFFFYQRENREKGKSLLDTQLIILMSTFIKAIADMKTWKHHKY